MWKHFLTNEYCTGFEPSVLENGWSDFTDRWTSDLSWKDAPLNGKFRPLYILNFVFSGANENRSSTGSAPRMTSVTWPSHVTWESSVIIILIHTWRQMTSDDVRWRQMTLLSRELSLLFCWVTPMSIWGKWKCHGGVSFEMDVNKLWTCSNLRNGSRNGGFKFLQF